MKKLNLSYRHVIMIAVLALCGIIFSSSLNAWADSYPSYAESGSYGTVKATLRVRQGPGTNYKQISKIYTGKVVHISGNITKTSDGNVWCYCDDYSGYIAINWLKDINYVSKKVTPTPTPTPTPGPTGTSEQNLYNLPDGLYTIRTVAGLALDVDHSGTQSGSNLLIYEFKKSENQIFRFTRQSDGSYMISSDYSGLCIDDNGANVKDGSNIQLWAKNDTLAQRWLLQKNSDGTFSILLTTKLTGSNSLYALDVESKADDTNCANVHLWSYHGDHNQRFYIEPVSNSGSYIGYSRNTVYRTGDAIPVSDILSGISVNNYSGNYSKNIVSVTKDQYAANISIRTENGKNVIRTDGVGVYYLKVKVSDNWGICPDMEKTITFKVLPKTKEEAMEVIQTRLNLKYMTKNGKYCGSGGYHTNCPGCEAHAVLKSEWLHQLFPEIEFDSSLFPQAGSCWTCYGSAQLIGYIEIQLLNTSPVKVKKVTVAKKNCKTVKDAISFINKNASCGDHIRIVNTGTTTGHSVMYLGTASGNKIHILDVNGRADKEKTNNRVAIRDYAPSIGSGGKDIYVFRYEAA